jgi:hypothetical protein
VLFFLSRKNDAPVKSRNPDGKVKSPSSRRRKSRVMRRNEEIGFLRSRQKSLTVTMESGKQIYPEICKKNRAETYY